LRAILCSLKALLYGKIQLCAIYKEPPLSSINAHYTFNYSQPEEYRFSHDSVFLARKVFELSQGKDTSAWQGLDLCSGCGVIGLDFIFHCMKELGTAPKHFDFMEVQEIYRSHFATNVATLNAPTACEFVNENYTRLQSAEFNNKYDLIVCNPPYFRVGHGKLSPSDFKNRCRFFMDSDFANLILGIESALKPGGRAYVLLRDSQEHGWSPLAEARKILGKETQIQELGDIRGTGLVGIQKRNNLS
jgi:tRNA1(Val) A37 N6-methylase TrmN6